MAGYQRQDDDGNISNGNIIDATDLNGEFDAIESAFNASTGHTHDGTDGQGARIEETGPAGQFTFTGTGMFPASGQNSLDLGSSSNRFDNAFFTTEVTTANLDVETSATITSLIIGSSTAVTSVDTDLASVSANDDTLASALAIKTYVDAQVTAQDLDITDGTNTGSIDLDSQSLTFTGSTGISATVDGQTITFTTSDGDIVHDNLSGFVANEHVDHSGVSITAGNGLTGGGNITATRTLSVDAHTGIGVTADGVALSHLGLEDLTDPGADRVAFWDDSASAFKWLTMGSNLSITDTTLNATDTDTTYSTATSSAQGLVKLFSDTQQTVAAQTISATSGRTYGVQLNGSNQMVVNVPWTDTSTTYTAGTNITLDGTTFNVDDAFVSNTGDTITGRFYIDNAFNDKLFLRGSNSPSIEFENDADAFRGRVGVSELNKEIRLVGQDPDDVGGIHILGIGQNGLRYSANNGLTQNKVWHEGNDGSASGLDADKLDGYHASSFVRTAGTDLSISLGEISLDSTLDSVTNINSSAGFILNAVGGTLSLRGTTTEFTSTSNDFKFFNGTSGDEFRISLTDESGGIAGTSDVVFKNSNGQMYFMCWDGFTPKFEFSNPTAAAASRTVDINLYNVDTRAFPSMCGTINFQMNNDAASPEKINYAYVTGIRSDDTEGSEKGLIRIGTFGQLILEGSGGGYYGDDTKLSAADDVLIYTNGTTLNSTFNDTNLTVVGALSKGSGSFKIDHPLPAKTETHHLVHSFIEGPQADLIYRGRVELVDGTATVNIDTAAGMTEGTFVVLCGDVQCFTSNETGWTAVKGSVSGNTLTITAQDNTCTDTISWMVVGERKDQHMIDTDWTDAEGHVIVEPEKA